MNGRERFQQMLRAPGTRVAFGVGDGLSARVAAEAGAELLYMSGYYVAATHGRPDVGLLTMTEMTTRCREITAAVDLPVIVDADDGYGGPANVARTVMEFERAGAVAIQLEDQPFPKKCGALSGLALLPPETMVHKIGAAVDARRDPSLALIARTDARRVEGFDAALARALAYQKAGADIVFFQMPESAEEIGKACAALSVPALFTFSESGRVPLLPPDELERLGVKIAVYPLTLMMAAITAMRKAAAELIRARTNRHLVSEYVPWDSVNRLTGLPDVEAFEARHH